MSRPTTIATGKDAASSRYSGKETTVFSARLTPKSVDLFVQSRDNLMILAIVAILVTGFAGTVIGLTLILR